MNNKYFFTPDWVSGFSQTDGSFTISFEKRNKGILFRPSPVFSLSQSIVEWDMFVSLQNYLGVGKVYKNRNGVILVVKSVDELISVIIPLFDKSPLRGSKLVSYLIWKTVVLLMKDKKHLNIKGLLQIIDIAYFMNKDTSLRSNNTKSKLLNGLAFKYGKLPTFEPLEYPKAFDPCPLTTEFVRGQIDGDGSFNVAFRTDSRRIGVNFTVVHEISSISVLYELVSFFKCGSVYKLPSQAARYQVQSINELIKYIIPFFKNMKLNTRKQQNFEVFAKVCEILNSSWYKDDETIKKIVELAWDMNLGPSHRKLSKDEYLIKFFPRIEKEDTSK